MYHMQRNHFSKWLNARALFPIAEMFREVSATEFSDMDEAKRYIFDSITAFRINKAKGVIAEFDRERYDEYLQFARIGQGSIGGKARGSGLSGFTDQTEQALVKVSRCSHLDSPDSCDGNGCFR